jgi:hypothetical protein
MAALPVAAVKIMRAREKKNATDFFMKFSDPAAIGMYSWLDYTTLVQVLSVGRVSLRL